MSRPAYKLPPYTGERWRSRKPYETRDVVDRTFGGDVVFSQPRVYGLHTVTIAEWFDWERTAKCIVAAKPPHWAQPL